MGSTVQQKPWIETPLIESTTLSQAAGCRIFLKLENLQPGTSFKSRGIGNLILHYINAERAAADPAQVLHFYSSSGGNAGLACVAAATSLGYKASVVLPTSTEEAMILRLQAAGATEVLVHGASWQHADNYLREIVIDQAQARGEKGIYIPPFDHPKIWEGHETMVQEIQRQMSDVGRPDAIVLSVGGGGMFVGINEGLDHAGWGDCVQVLAMNTVGADALAQSIQQRQIVTLPAITSIATSLGAIRVGNQTFKHALRRNVTSIVLEDAEAAMGCWRFADDERILVEPACGVSVALAYDGRLKRYLNGFNQDSKVVIIVCGGARVSLDDLRRWKEKFGARAEELGTVSRALAEEKTMHVNGAADEAEGKVPSSVMG